MIHQNKLDINCGSLCKKVKEEPLRYLLLFRSKYSNFEKKPTWNELIPLEQAKDEQTEFTHAWGMFKPQTGFLADK